MDGHSKSKSLGFLIKISPVVHITLKNPEFIAYEAKSHISGEKDSQSALMDDYR